ncbi:hypothetical protein DFJ58DRAFT_839674 [Suillus subalutaceus]|uniref:uncharacterized protein n=1 Tax=Suillus subalutaceus TaxID=48586 RepID=UPI001B876034|nr:uncharacterized protein DFJ58DRAFT_839674 [Suillus subalutaceus]KAG1861530.1 hypothetical protein DFJ58DRAFT_839674 [Suillus subalutaceus]
MARHSNQQPQPPQVPVPLGTVPIPGLPDMQALQSLLAALGPNAMAILSSMQGGIPMHHIPQHAPQPLLAALPPPAPVIDPQPRAELPLNALNHVLQRLETIEKSLKRPQHDEDNNADDEGDDRIRVAIYNLTGIIASDIGKPKDSDDKDSSDDKDETRDDRLLMFDFRADVSAPQNSNICEIAAEIVWMEQQANKESFNLMHKDINFNKANILMFTKDKFRNYKCKYDERTHVEKGKTCQMNEGRLKAIKLFKKCNDGQDPSLLMETDFMSEEVSQLDTDDDFNSVMDKLDQIRAEQRKKAGNKATCTRCINLNNKNTAPPQQPIFPFMLNMDWYKAYVDDNPGMKVVVLKKDPIGFGLVDEPNETADDSGAKTTDTMDVNGDGTDGEDETAEDARL